MLFGPHFIKSRKTCLGARAKEDSEAVVEQSVAAIQLIEPGSTQVDQRSALKSPLESPSRRKSPP